MLGRVPNPSSALQGAAVLADPLVAELVVQPLVAVLATYEPDGAIHPDQPPGSAYCPSG